MSLYVICEMSVGKLYFESLTGRGIFIIAILLIETCTLKTEARRVSRALWFED